MPTMLSATAIVNCQLVLIVASGLLGFAVRFNLLKRLASPTAFLWAGTLLNLPLHVAIVGLGLALVSDKYRRRRMGSLGVLHAVMNVATIVSFYFLGFHEYEPSPLMALAIHAIASTLSTLSALGLLWMIPAVSKRHSRFFACAYVACFAIAWAQMSNLLDALDVSDRYIWMTVKSIHAAALLPGLLLCLVNYFDVVCCFVLDTFERRFKAATDDPPPKRSSAYVHPAAKRTFWRSFRKSETVKYLFPLRDVEGQMRQASAFDLTQTHESVRPSMTWIIYSIGETGTMLVLLNDYARSMGNGCLSAYELGVLYNVYAVVTFGITLVLKAKLSVDSFKVYLAHDVLTSALLFNTGTSFNTEWIVYACILYVMGMAVGAMTWWVSEPISSHHGKLELKTKPPATIKSDTQVHRKND